MAEYIDPEIFDNPPNRTLDDIVVDEIYNRLRPGSLGRAMQVADILRRLYGAVAYYDDPDLRFRFYDVDPEELEAMVAALDALLGKLRDH